MWKTKGRKLFLYFFSEELNELKIKNWKLPQKQVKSILRKNKWNGKNRVPSSLSIWEWNDNFIIYKWQGCEKHLWKSFTDPVTYFKLSFSIQLNLPVSFLQESYSHALILQTTPDPLRSHQWACPRASQLLPLPYPSFPSLLLLLSHPAKKLEVIAQRSTVRQERVILES